MIRIVLSALLLAFLALPAFAGETTIRETEDGIVVEYTPSEEESKAAAAERETEQKKAEVEAAKQERINERDAAKKARSEGKRQQRSED